MVINARRWLLVSGCWTLAGLAAAQGCALLAGVEDGELSSTTSGGAGAATPTGGSGGAAGAGAQGAAGTGGVGGTTSTGGTGGTGGSGAAAGGSTGGTGGGTGSGTPTGTSPTDPYYDAVMADGPIAYFRLAESGGTICQNEISGSSITATYPTSGATRAVTGIRPENSAIRFDANTAQLSVFGGLDFPGDVPFTVEAWIKIEDASSTGRFFDHCDSPPLHGTWLGSYNGKVRTETWLNGTHIFYTMSQADFPENTFLHIVFKHVAGDRDYLYVNGSEGEGSRLAAGDRAEVTAVFTWSGFVGVLDEFAVYDKALSTPRIAAHLVAQAQ